MSGGGVMEFRKALIISHERSGTHFLLNTLILNFGYHPKRIDLDYPLGLNFHSPRALARFFRQFRGRPISNIFKSHHSFGFFEPILDSLLDEFHVFYVYRDPRDVMTSFWRFLSTLRWDEGPKTPDVGSFMRSPPSGAMLRYQKRQIATCLERWEAHVRPWLAAGRGRESAPLTFVRYEDLHLSFERTVRELAVRLGRPCEGPVRPDPRIGVVGPWRGEVGSHREFFTREDETWLAEALGDETRRLFADLQPAA